MRKLMMTTLASVLALPAVANNPQVIDLDAGLWEYSIVLEVDHIGVVTRETQQFCLSEAESNMTASDVINDLSEGQCTASDVVLLVGSGSANMTCVYPQENARGVGRLEVSYTATGYDVDATTTLTGPGGTSNVTFTGQARRLSDC